MHPGGVPADRALARALTVDAAVRTTQRLVDARGNQCPPRELANQAVAIASATGFAVRVHEHSDLVREGMGGLLAVAAGSSEEPFLVELWRNADGTMPSEPPIGALALVGKGVTFDSGGLSLKSAESMVGMHTDKAGAATVLGALSSLASQPTTHAVHAVLPLAENMPGAGATRPGDVVTTLSGIGIEIVDTDFEGRVMLADALAWASRARPRAILDLATLTYQAVIALGPDIGALIARDPTLGRAVEAAARRAGEPLWSLPWAPRYQDQLVSTAPGATLRNHPGTSTARALTAALFLGEFVPDHIPWAHLDFAGPAAVGSGARQTSTGYGTHLLHELLLGEALS
ncbi:leucyl aminopeptidase family protein [Nocardioides sp. LHD-245]|uniref:M17 family metallopeptidase n=1 Tax=Nocardioides sp. LHD-245 TaxID=3051387 RepID=UPI0027DFCC4F|nr:leucyl aminopeptidase family protein [Nocardioides sp. LHD-245]